MKTIGLIGGMSYESTIPYYKIINDEVNKALGGLHSAKVVLYSVDFDEIESRQRSNDWDECGQILKNAAISLEKAGADIILICTNTMHKVFQDVQAGVKVPVLHIAKATASKLIESNVKKVALLGTIYTMTQDFYKSVLIESGLEVVIPDDIQMQEINRIIFEELCKGKIVDSSREYFSKVIDSLKAKGAQAVILGCTEIGLLVTEDKSALKVFDTTVIHAKAAVEAALKQ
jgi:aspartate racemase